MKTIDDSYGAVYQIITASDLDPDFHIKLVSTSIAQVRKLFGGGSGPLTIEYEAAQPITLGGWVNEDRPSKSRPLQGVGVTGGQRVLTGTGTLRLLLGGGFWTILP